MKTKHKYSDKIHCFNCGKLRNGRLAFITETTNAEDPTKLDGTVYHLNIKNFHKVAALYKDVELPKRIFGQCNVCNTQTFYQLTPNRKLEVVDI